jgi:hypothetical protein
MRKTQRRTTHFYTDQLESTTQNKKSTSTKQEQKQNQPYQLKTKLHYLAGTGCLVLW